MNKKHFTTDPYLPKGEMLALYRGWVENSIKRDDGYLIGAERRDSGWCRGYGQRY